MGPNTGVLALACVRRSQAAEFGAFRGLRLPVRGESHACYSLRSAADFHHVPPIASFAGGSTCTVFEGKSHGRSPVGTSPTARSASIR